MKTLRITEDKIPVPDKPVILFMEGDGTGREITVPSPMKT